MGKITLGNIKSAIAKSGSSKGKFMFFKEGTKAPVNSFHLQNRHADGGEFDGIAAGGSV